MDFDSLSVVSNSHENQGSTAVTFVLRNDFTTDCLGDSSRRKMTEDAQNVGQKVSTDAAVPLFLLLTSFKAISLKLSQKIA